MRSAAILLALLGCTDDPVGPTPRWAPDGDGFWDRPWPTDARRDPDGTISFAGWPNPAGVPLLDSYVSFAEAFDGFGTNSPIYVSFDGPIDPRTLPTPEASLAPDSPIVLVDVDPASPGFGTRVPLQWEVRDHAGPSYQAEHLLAVAPVFGFPLRPRTRYALLITTAIARRAPGFDAVWSPLDDEHALYADLADALPLLGIDRNDVAVATTFTTRDPVDEMARIAWFLRERVGLPDLDLDLERLEVRSHYRAFRTHYPSPVFTHGERPYDFAGGGFEWDDDGNPTIASWDDMRLAVCTPLDTANPPPSGWPVVIYQHGTGGYYRGYCDSNATLEVANLLGTAGFVSVGIDQPLHGTRGLGTDLSNFNLFNPDSGVSNFRQGAIDALYLAHALHDRQWVMRTPDGVDVPLDPDRVFFMGHSQGGLTGALATPFFGGDVAASMLSGAGGVLAITVVVRDDIIDFKEVITNLLGLPEGEELTPMHPVLGLVQTAVEVTDPVNYGPYFFAERGHWDFQVPTPVLLTSGTLDEATDYTTALALGAAARLPIVRPQVTSSIAHDLRGIPKDQNPLVADAVAYDGTRVTAGMSQYRGGTHWVVFEWPEAADLYVDFLSTAAEGTAVIDRP